MSNTKQVAKTLILARFGMLECGRNFKGSMRETCNECNAVDDEDHRLNYCSKFRGVNNFDSPHKVVFKNVFSNDPSIFQKILKTIDQVWNTQTSHGTMRS